MNDATTRVIMIRGNDVRELKNLPDVIMVKLEEEFEKTPVRGLSLETYQILVEFFNRKLADYEKELAESGDNDLYARSIAFAHAFDIFPDESPAFFDMMLYIERSVKNKPDFDSRKICCRNIKAFTGKDWREANKDFKNWSCSMFDDTGMRIGIVRMAKFYYSIIKSPIIV